MKKYQTIDEIPVPADFTVFSRPYAEGYIVYNLRDTSQNRVLPYGSEFYHTKKENAVSHATLLGEVIGYWERD